ncbi:MAG: hypothetical protein B6244_03505 [Candidatus Cloacimonetes bacterium 4572_55]|nr:MAG: hypothetical protein B6244_03505 [Candidatus Cloacimonetes bacterium 4572_55]
MPNRKNSSRSSIILKNTLTNYLQFAIKLLITFITLPIIIRYLGVERYGLWGLTMSMVGFLTTLDLGFGTSITKYVAETKGEGDTERRNRIVSSIFSVYLAISVAVILIVAIAAQFYGDIFDLPDHLLYEAKWALILIGIRVALNFPFSVYRGILFGQQRIALLNSIEITVNIVEAVVVITTLYYGYGIIGYATIYLISYLIKASLRLFFAYRETKNLHVTPRLFQREKLWEVTSFSLYAFMTVSAAAVAIQMDFIIIKLFDSLAAVAIYSVAIRVSRHVIRMARKFLNVLVPLIAELKGAGDRESIRRVMLEGTKLSLLIVTPTTIALLYFCSDLITYWVGEEFAESAQILTVFLITVFPTVIRTNAGNILNMSGHHRFAARATIVGAIINVTLSVILIHFFGLIGVAFGTFVAISLVQLAVVDKVCRIYQISISDLLKRSVLPILPPMIPALSGVWVLNRLFPPTNLFWVVVYMGIEVLIYVLFMYFFSFSQSERYRYGKKLKRFVRRNHQE